MIRLDRLSVRVGDFLLQDISFEVPAGGYGLLIGPSGSGKTTLLETVAGHVTPLGGRVHLHGADMTDVSPERRGVGFVYQNYHLFPHLGVRGIDHGLVHACRCSSSWSGSANSPSSLASRPCSTRSSHRMRWRRNSALALARALAPRPSILLLKPSRSRRWIPPRGAASGELQAIHTHERVTTLQVTHDFDEALRLGGVVAVLAEGRIAQLGRPDEVFPSPTPPSWRGS